MDNYMTLIKTTVEKTKERFESMKSNLDFQKESMYAIQILQKNEYLQKSITEAPETLQGAIINVATCGISLNPALQYAYLVPRRNNTKGRVECILDVSYRGLIHLLTLSGGVSNVYANIRYKGDEFDMELGTAPKITHKPKFESKEILGVYAVAVLPNGTTQFDYVSKDEIDNIKMRSEMGKKDTGSWKTDYGEMARKTAIKRLSKYLPKNNTMLRAMEAIHLDNENNSIDFEAEQARILNTKKHEQVTTTVQRAINQAKGKTPEKEIVEQVKEQMLLLNSNEETMDYLNGLPQETKELPEVKKLIEENL